MRRLMLVAVLIGCGHHGGNAIGGGDDDATLDAAGQHGDGGSGDAGGDGSGGDDTVETGCAQPVAPTVTLSVASPNNGTGMVFRAGDQILAKPLLDEAHTWLRWTSGGWSSESIPWPSNLRTDINHYIARVVPLANTRALIVTDDRWIMTYDGTTMSPAIQPPSAAGLHIWGISQDASDAYHLFWGTQEWISKPDGTWYPPAPIPIPLQGDAPDNVVAAAAIMRSGRIVVLYLDENYNAPARHAHLVSRGPNEPWTNAVDITTQWAVNAQDPQLYAPPGGGIAINVTGASTSYSVSALWRSTDGVTLGDYESLDQGGMISFAGECLDSLVINGTAAPSGFALWKPASLGWATFAGHPLSGVYANHVGLAALPDGKTFWVFGKYGGADYLVSP